jgi:hypothetical protein
VYLKVRFFICASQTFLKLYMLKPILQNNDAHAKWMIPS